MHQYYQQLTTWLHIHPHWGWLVAFIIAFAESIAVIGSIIPGSVTMTAIGILAGSGVLPIWSVILSAILGAIIGDGLSYFSGYYFQDSLRRIWPFSKHPQILSKGQLFFAVHGGKSVFIGRFVGPVRAIVPIIAGSLHFPPRRYFTASILSAIGWAPAYMLPGILLGAISLEMPAHVATELFFVVLVFLLAIWALLWLTKKIYHKTRNFFNLRLDKKWEDWTLQPSKRWICFCLRNGEHPETHGQLLIFFVALVLFLLFLFLFLNVVAHGPLTYYNNLVYHWFRGLRTYRIDAFFIMMTTLGTKTVIATTTIAVTIWLLLIKRWRAAGCFMLAIGGAMAIAYLTKHFYFSPRPTGILANPINSSYPSGHTTGSIICYSMIAFLLAYKRTKVLRKTIYWITFILCFFVGLSRLYLGAHWLTDVTGATLLSLSALYFSVILYRRQPESPIPWRGLLVVTLISMATASSYYLQSQFSILMNNSQPYWKTIDVSEHDWWSQRQSLLPTARTDRLGRPVEVLNIQWSGHINQMRQSLLSHHWQNISNNNYLLTLEKIAHQERKVPHPLLAKLYRDQHPVLEMIKYPHNQTPPLILRLWPADVRLTPDKATLYIGTLYFQTEKKETLLSFLHLQRHEETMSVPTELHYLLSALSHYQWETKSLSTTDIPKKLRGNNPYRTIILIRPKTSTEKTS